MSESAAGYHRVSRTRILAILTAALGALWALTSSWLTAHNLIPVTTEITGDFFSVVAVLVAGLVCFASDDRPKWQGRLLTLLWTSAGILIEIVGCQMSDDNFLRWKMHAIDDATWNRMISELRAIDEKGQAEEARIDITKEQGGLFNPTTNKVLMVPVPEVFDALGRRDDFMGGHAGVGNDPAMFYGVKSRRWGLEIGTNDFSHGHWATFKRVKVGENAWLFAGPDD